MEVADLPYLSRLPKITLAPCRASSRTTIRPRPQFPPVTMAVRPCWSGISSAVHLLVMGDEGRPLLAGPEHLVFLQELFEPVQEQIQCELELVLVVATLTDD